MPWFYDSRTGAYAEEAGILGFLSNLQAKFGLGWHQYASQADMLAAIKANGWPAPNNNPSNPIGKTVVGSAESAVKAVAAPGDCCLIKVPVLGACIFTRTDARALMGGLVIGAGGLLTIVGLALLMVEGFQRSGAGAAAGRSLETVGAGLAFVPGLEGAGLAVGATGAATKRAGSTAGASGSLRRRQTERTAAAGQTGQEVS